jgi:hypothetical protein
MKTFFPLQAAALLTGLQAFAKDAWRECRKAASPPDSCVMESALADQ